MRLVKDELLSCEVRMTEDMEELICIECGCSVGWIIDCGPHGFVYCERCYEDEDEENGEDVNLD